MSKVQCKFKRVIKSAFLLLIFSSVTNCNQFATFSGSEEESYLSTNPVFENPDETFVGRDDDIIVTPQPTNPVVTPPTTTLPPFRWCGRNNNRFQFLLPDGSGDYTECGGCVARDQVVIDGARVPICRTTRCGEDQYRFFDEDNPNVSPTCRRCDELSDDGESCDIPILPPVPPQPPTPPVTTPEPPVQPPVPPTPPKSSDDDDDGGGSGDPLMIDSVGVAYASAKELRNSDASYFKSGDLDLTAPFCDSSQDSCQNDLVERTNFQGFNLLGRQNQTVLNDGDFLHIKSSGKNFKFQKMSWTRRSQDRYRFLALPNAQGNVLGIDQLFGDNTFGPDPSKPFARDGFRALMKYDKGDAFGEEDLADGYIDSNDAVFSKLRLWHDLNGDGNVDTAQERATELVSLRDKKITYIHLRPNEKFFETDQYGNDIAYKSIVGFESPGGVGLRLGTAFDMWFQYQPREILDAGLGTREQR